MKRPLTVWLDEHAIAALPNVVSQLTRVPAQVMRSFARVPNPSMVAQFKDGEQVAVIGGRDLNELVSRLEVATTTLPVGVIGVLPRGVKEPSGLKGPGVVDVLPAGTENAASRIALMAKVPIVSVRSAKLGASAGKAPGAVGALISASKVSPAAFAAGAQLERKTLFVSTEEHSVLAFASSTGGCWVLAELVRAVHPNERGPILLAQHMDSDFVAFFASWLESSTGWKVTLVDGRAPLENGTIFIAAGGQDLCAAPDGQHVVTLPPCSRFIPNADRLFESVAKAFGPRAIGVVLSGMGDDGARGLAELIRRGGRGVCQLPSSAIIPSMPQSALQAAPGAIALAPDALASSLSVAAR